MVDKLDLRVPPGTPFAQSFQTLFDSEARKTLKPSKHYQKVGDFSRFGVDAILHLNQRKSKTHKLELLGVGALGFTQIERQITEIFEVDPTSLEIMRLDLAADVEGVPVSWFCRNARVANKQVRREIGTTMGEVKYDHQTGHCPETLYFGKRPNCFRIYNRTAMLLEDYRRGSQQAAVCVRRLSFDEVYGFSPDLLVTRVERQYSGRGVPDQTNTVKALKSNAAELDPFDPLELLPGGKTEPQLEDCGLDNWLKGMSIRSLIDCEGYAAARRKLNIQGNAARLLKKFKAFLPSNAQDFEVPNLYERYRRSVMEQIEA